MVEDKKKVGRPKNPPKKKDEVEKAREETEKELKGNPVEDSRPKQIPFVNITNLKFRDISYEHVRQYLFANGAKIEIMFPLKLSIDRSNIHRVFDANGLSYFIPPNWIAIVTKPKPGAPNIAM